MFLNLANKFIIYFYVTKQIMFIKIVVDLSIYLSLKYGQKKKNKIR